MEIQSVFAYKKDGWNAGLLLNWLLENGIQPIKNAHYVGDEIRFRIKNPIEGKKFSTRILKNNIRLVFIG